MSRIPYEVHRARKRASHARAGSATPTETEFDFDGASSLASYSTHVTSSSYRPSPPSQNGFDDPEVVRRRNLSPSSRGRYSPTQSSFGQVSTSTYPSSTLPSRQSSSQINGYPAEYGHSSSSSGLLLPDTKSRRSSRPGETEEERRIRREKRRAERHGLDVDAPRRALKSSYKAKMKKEREDEEEAKTGSYLKDLGKWCLKQDKPGSRWRGLICGLGGVLSLRIGLIALLVMLDSRIRLARATPTTSSGDVGANIPGRHTILFSRASSLLMEIAVLWPGVIIWTKLEGRRKGRSWRTQLVGILTILSQPALMFSAAKSPHLSVALGLGVWTLVRQSRSLSIIECGALSLLVGCGTVAFRTGWSLVPGLVCYLLAQCVSLSGRRGLAFIAIFVLSISIMMAAFVQLSATTWIGISTLQRFSIRSSLATLVPRRAAEVASVLSAFVDNLQNNWMRYLGMILSQIPVSIIMMFSALSIRSTHTGTIARSTSPIATLLPLSLAASSVPLFLLSTSNSTLPAHEVLFAILPITLMMGLRGDEDVWDVGVMISNLTMFRLRRTLALLSSATATISWILITVGWNILIGHSPRRLRDETILRRAAYVIYAIISGLSILDLLGQAPLPLAIRMSLPASLASYLAFENYSVTAVYWAVWVWVVKKLLESAWAIGGFEDLDVGKRTKIVDPPKFVVQIADTT